MAKRNIDKKMEDNIKNYQNQIVTIEDFVAAVRQMPGMYIGHIGNQGFITMIREVFQNSTDEVVKQSSPANMISVSYDDRSLQVVIEDNGRGIPFDDIIRIMTKEHTSSNYEKKDWEFSSGLHGLGAKVTNSLSAKFTVQSYILGQAKQVDFVEGYPVSEPYNIPNNDKQGTVITFTPSSVMGPISVTHKEVYNLVSKLLPLLPLGTKIAFNYITIEGKKHSEILVNEDGLITELIYKTQSPLIKPIVLQNFTGKMKAEVAFTYGLEDGLDEDVTSYSNICPTNGGTHVNGFIDGLIKYFRDYMNKVYLNNNNKIQITASDIRTGVKALVSVSHLNPIFTGQIKEILSNEDMYYFVKDMTVKGLEDWAKVNPNDLQKVAKYLKDIAQSRMKNDVSKLKLSNQYKQSALDPSLPEKYTKPSGKFGIDNLELVIVEGESAGGQAEESRCKIRQGIMPIKGKIPNALSTPKAKFLSNEEIAGIITIIGAGYGKNCDPSKAKVNKIICMSDADPDGDHIATLVLIFFIVYLRPLLEAGMLYKAVPPLFGVKRKNGYDYYTTRMDLINYVNKEFSKKNTIANIKGKTLSLQDVAEVLYRNADYDYELDVISNRYAIEPTLLELVLLHKDKPLKELSRILKQQFKYVGIEKIHDTVKIQGLIGSKINTVFLNDKLLYDSRKIIDSIHRINNSNIYFILNGVVVSIYQLLTIFNKSMPSSITRFKGLGQMDDWQLSESTIHPDKNRTIVQYTMESAQEEIDMIKRLQTNKYDLIRDITISRQDLLG